MPFRIQRNRIKAQRPLHESLRTGKLRVRNFSRKSKGDVLTHVYELPAKSQGVFSARICCGLKELIAVQRPEGRGGTTRERDRFIQNMEERQRGVWHSVDVACDAIRIAGYAVIGNSCFGSKCGRPSADDVQSHILVVTVRWLVQLAGIRVRDSCELMLID